nr:hypothetical protein Iba_chr04aCG25060 [Ipomoea batatas]
MKVSIRRLIHIEPKLPCLFLCKTKFIDLFPGMIHLPQCILKQFLPWHHSPALLTKSLISRNELGDTVMELKFRERAGPSDLHCIDVKLSLPPLAGQEVNGCHYFVSFSTAHKQNPER